MAKGIIEVSFFMFLLIPDGFMLKVSMLKGDWFDK